MENVKFNDCFPVKVLFKCFSFLRRPRRSWFSRHCWCCSRWTIDGGGWRTPKIHLFLKTKIQNRIRATVKKNLGFESFISKVRILTLNSKFWHFFLNFEVFSQKSDFFSLNLTLNSKFRLLFSEIWHFFLQMLTFNSKSWCFFSKIWWGFLASF